MFKRALKSVVPCADLFQKIVISINGKDGAEDLRQVHESGLDLAKIELFETKTDLIPIKHGIWFAAKLIYLFKRDDRVVLLAHDDELIADSFREWHQIYPRYGERVAWIGNYEVCEDHSANHFVMKEMQEALPPSGFLNPVSLLEWLAHNQSDPRGHVFTNMSGISIPFGAYLDFISWQKLTFGKVGARSEYMFLSHRSISGIMGSKRPYVRIHQHVNQEGRSVPSIEYAKDGLRYCIWLLINAKNFGEFWWVLKSRWGIRGILSSVKSLLVHILYVRQLKDKLIK